MILYFVSGYSIGDFVANNGVRRLLRMAFKSPRLVWQMGGAGFMRFLLRSRRTHVLIGSGDLVLDRQFCSDSITTVGTVMSRPDLEGWIDIGSKSSSVPSRPVPRSDGVFKVTLSFLILYATRGRWRLFLKSDCVTVAKWYLTRAGVVVPDAIWNPDGLIRYLERLGYTFTPAGEFMGSIPVQGPLKAFEENPELLKKLPKTSTNPILKTGDSVGAPKIPKQEPLVIPASPGPANPVAQLLISPTGAAGKVRKDFGMFGSRSFAKGKRPLTVTRNSGTSAYSS